MRYVSAVRIFRGRRQRHLLLWLGGGEAGGGQDFFVEGDEEAFGSGEDGAFGVAELGLVEELAAFALQVLTDENERLVERGGAEVVDLHVAGHGEDVEGAIELAHGLVEECGYDAAVDVAGWAFVAAVELEVGGCDGGVGAGVGGEDEVEALRVCGAAAEAVAGALVEGGVAVHGGWGVPGCVG